MELKTELTHSYADSRHGSKTLILKQIDKSPCIRNREAFQAKWL